MKKTTKAIVASGVTVFSALSLSAIAGYTLFNEIMNRNAKLFPVVASKTFDKQNTESENKDTDPRVLWFREQSPVFYEMINSKNYKLKARMIPAENSKLFVFCSHGYRNNGASEYELMTKFYHDLGYNVFIVDHAAHGESEGKYIGFGYHEYKDCIDWLKWMVEKFGDDIQIVLQGISMGSATVMMMSGDDELTTHVKFTVADCGYTTAKAEIEYDIKEFIHLPEFPIVDTANLFNKHFNGYNFYDANPLDAVAKTKVPILFIHGDSDTFVPTYMVHQLYANCGTEEKDLLLVKGAGHAESYRKNSTIYEEKIKEFTSKYIK